MHAMLSRPKKLSLWLVCIFKHSNHSGKQNRRTVILLHINLKPFGTNKQKYTKLNCYPKSIHSHQLTIFSKSLIVAKSNSSFRKKIINIIFFIGKSCLLRAAHNKRKMSAIKSETGVITLVRHSHLAANHKLHITHFFEPTT